MTLPGFIFTTVPHCQPTPFFQPKRNHFNCRNKPVALYFNL
ncbi:hypothetical protein HMPREF9103_02875 [Lentilactobacillus parafarraginis F0439]|uniref:Uncharacterized protein n=1 Tax=Lentilactobacillus parafarraginis F0439 TaxID=797515 RepID=G9ZSV9_9LACO|nr:hypothetical protein HMPREF9103_02875 [Lentilactobacillus parafarraginis F0439]